VTATGQELEKMSNAEDAMDGATPSEQSSDGSRYRARNMAPIAHGVVVATLWPAKTTTLGRESSIDSAHAGSAREL
jgi:hypothetical protein